MNGTFESVLLCNVFHFDKEAVRALWLEFCTFAQKWIREFLFKNGCKVSREK